MNAALPLAAKDNQRCCTCARVCSLLAWQHGRLWTGLAVFCSGQPADHDWYRWHGTVLSSRKAAVAALANDKGHAAAAGCLRSRSDHACIWFGGKCSPLAKLLCLDPNTGSPCSHSLPVTLTFACSGHRAVKCTQTSASTGLPARLRRAATWAAPCQGHGARSPQAEDNR